MASRGASSRDMDLGVMGLDGLIGQLCSSGQGGEALYPKLAAYHQMLLRSSKDGWKTSKVNTAEDLTPSNGPDMLRSASLIIPTEPEPQECMLSFSSSHKPVATIAFLSGTDSNSINPSARGYYSSPAFKPGGNSGSLNPSLHGGFGVVCGPFTPSQWMELEHQALIYKYMMSNVPIPSNLLTPIKKYLHPCLLSSSTIGSYQSSSVGWSPFHMGYFGNTTDPEPGRCRRTDGKKWRCSRDAVADQKYCERHMNRGRHRSRKPVEGRPGHSAASTAAKKLGSTPEVSPDCLTNREQDSGKTFGDDTCKSQFGSKDYEGIRNGEKQHLCLLSDHNRPVLFWSDEIKSDWTQLSMAIPAEPLDPNLPSLTPAQGTLFGAGSGEFNHHWISKRDDLEDLVQKQSGWIPMSWESGGGPLGEALATRNDIKYKSISSRTFVADDNTEVGTSPTGVWQKTMFDSLSSTSSGCSPSTESKKITSGSLCSSVISSSVNFNSPIPLL